MCIILHTHAHSEVMSLLAGVEDREYSSDEELIFGSPSRVTGQLVESKEPLSGRGGGRGKKEIRRGRTTDEKKSKYKEKTVKEKAPKKSKSQGKLLSLSPHNSPKLSVRHGEGKGAGQSATLPASSGGTPGGGQLQASQSQYSKNQRKNYSQLGTGFSFSPSSSDEGEESGVLVNKQLAMRELQSSPAERQTDSGEDRVESTNPFLAGSHELFKDHSAIKVDHTHMSTDHTHMEPTGAAKELAQQQAWVPMATTVPPFASPPVHQGVATFNSSLLMSTNFDVFGDPSSSQLAQAFGTGSFLEPTQQLQFPPSEGVGMEMNPFAPPPVPPPSQQPLVATSSVAPTNTSSATAMSGNTPTSSEDWAISEELRSKCLQQFAELQPVHGVLEGSRARQFFTQSKLPYQELSSIWYVLWPL